MFSALSFLKSKLRNKLDKNVDTFLILYVTSMTLTIFHMKAHYLFDDQIVKEREKTISQIYLKNLIWNIMFSMIIMTIHLEKVMFRMSKMQAKAKMWIGKWISPKIVYDLIHMRDSWVLFCSRCSMYPCWWSLYVNLRFCFRLK